MLSFFVGQGECPSVSSRLDLKLSGPSAPAGRQASSRAAGILNHRPGDRPSVAAFFSVAFDTEGRPADIDMIVDGAQRILVSKGFDQIAARGELERRLTRRADLTQLGKVSGAAEASARQFHRAADQAFPRAGIGHAERRAPRLQQTSSMRAKLGLITLSQRYRPE